jgi:type I restriction enzyme M protein
VIVDLIDAENWSVLGADVKGDAYDGLLERNAQAIKSGAGQYFMPRVPIQAMVTASRPGPASCARWWAMPTARWTSWGARS